MRKYQALQGMSSTNSIDEQFFFRLVRDSVEKNYQRNALRMERNVQCVEKKAGENPWK